MTCFLTSGLSQEIQLRISCWLAIWPSLLDAAMSNLFVPGLALVAFPGNAAISYWFPAGSGSGLSSLDAVMLQSYAA